MDIGASTIPAGTVLTPVFESTHEELGRIAVVVEGSHDIDADDFFALDHDRYAVRISAEGVLSPLLDTEVAQKLFRMSTSYLYIRDSDYVTSPGQPTFEDDLSTATLKVPGYERVTALCAGVVEVENRGVESLYQIYFANPTKGVYLVVVQEILPGDPPTLRAINAEDEGLCNAIADQFLIEIGVVDFDGEEEGFEQDDDMMPDTAEFSQNWTLPSDIDES